jgi:hypothetical protein
MLWRRHTMLASVSWRFELFTRKAGDMHSKALKHAACGFGLALFLSLLGATRATAQPAPALPQTAAQAACTALTALDLSGQPGGPGQIVSATAANGRFCDVRGYIAPHVQFAVRLPLYGWNQKLLFQGCGGFCGSLNIERADDALARGYATATTDMGHTSTATDAKWAFNNRPAEIDFGYRATHVATQAAKTIVDAYYAVDRRYTYFRGCSTGGRQGLMAAQRFPNDYDGIIAGAPVRNYLAGNARQLIWSALANLDAKGQPILDEAAVRSLHAGAMAACDAKDGLKDGVIDAPRTCGFKPEALICAPGQTQNCLSPAQAAAARKIYQGPETTPGTPDWFGAEVGSELNWLGNYVGLGKEPALMLSFMGELFRYMAFADDPGPSFAPTSLDFTTLKPRLAEMDAVYAASDPDLAAFKARGGKLIGYHGWADHSVIPMTFVEYHDAVVARMGGLAQSQAFFRLFMVPGLNHCRSGAGAHDFDPLPALEAWVERGEAPERIVATNGKKEASPMVRPLFPYPARAVYRGWGDANALESWRSRVPKK